MYHLGTQGFQSDPSTVNMEELQVINIHSSLRITALVPCQNVLFFLGSLLSGTLFQLSIFILPDCCLLVFLWARDIKIFMIKDTDKKLGWSIFYLNNPVMFHIMFLGQYLACLVWYLLHICWMKWRWRVLDTCCDSLLGFRTCSISLAGF